jgi:hypothetical protein
MRLALALEVSELHPSLRVQLPGTVADNMAPPLPQKNGFRIGVFFSFFFLGTVTDNIANNMPPRFAPPKKHRFFFWCTSLGTVVGSLGTLGSPVGSSLGVPSEVRT